MAQIKQIKLDSLKQLINNMINSGITVIAPKKKADKVFFAKINNFDEITFDYIQTALSAKSVLFPRNEEMVNYNYDNAKINIVEPLYQQSQMVVFGARPCDTATIEYLSRFFLDENPDKSFKHRLDNTTFISLACNKADEFCFCTTVGGSPADTKGTDILLTDFNNGSFYVESITEKGNKIISNNQKLFEDSKEQDKTKYTAKVENKFNVDNLIKKIDEIFESPTWKQQSLACLGCGACAFACPTCTCFDIQEDSNPCGGTRLRTWDTCALGLFTLHASGHNPRTIQSQRWRQRLKHKFEYTKETMGIISCVGCGRCIRICPAQMNIIDNVISLVEA